MVHVRRFVLAFAATSVPTATLLACEASERRSAPEEPDASNPPEASLPGADAGTLDVDAAKPKPDYDASDEPVVCTSMPCVTELVGGLAHFCALLSDGSVRCWGRDVRGSLGRGETAESPTGTRPMPVVGITNATQISVGTVGAVTCVRNTLGRVQCWGDNEFGQLGLQATPALSDFDAHPTPSDVALTTEVARVDVGPKSVCAFGTAGDVYCWGDSSEGKLARLDDDASEEGPARGPGLADLRGYGVTRIFANLSSVFGLTKDGQFLGWGAASGRDSSLAYSSTPYAYPTLTDVKTVSVGVDTQCLIMDGNVYCWGNNEYGNLGTDVPAPSRLPMQARIAADGKTFPQRLAIAGPTSCVRMTDGTVQCCGANYLGQLGTDSGVSSPLFARVAALEGRVVQLAASTTTICALTQGGKVLCWGDNSGGQLGQGTSDAFAHPSPVTVSFE